MRQADCAVCRLAKAVRSWRRGAALGDCSVRRCLDCRPMLRRFRVRWGGRRWREHGLMPVRQLYWRSAFHPARDPDRSPCRRVLRPFAIRRRSYRIDEGIGRARDQRGYQRSSQARGHGPLASPPLRHRFRMTSAITEYDYPSRFVDEQQCGRFRR